jgi:hypothetical protein
MLAGCLPGRAADGDVKNTVLLGRKWLRVAGSPDQLNQFITESSAREW